LTRGGARTSIDKPSRNVRCGDVLTVAQAARFLAVRVEDLGGFRVRRLDPSTADLIVAVDGKRVRTVEELLTEVESHAPGATIKLGILREGEVMEIPVVLGES
jgi:C-terminal processing protease CtpA/Prc